MIEFDRSNKKRFVANTRFFVSRHMLLLMMLSCIAILSNCTKSKVLPVTTTITTPPVNTTSAPAPKYVYTSNPEISISSYICPYSSYVKNTTFIGKLYGSKSGNYSFAGIDNLYAHAYHDSLFLTQEGVYQLFSAQKLDLNILATDDSVTYSKSVTLFPNSFVKNRTIAHRGAYLLLGYPDNSLAALKQTFVLGCQGSEFDVHLTLDKVLVVCHDDTYGGYTIEKATYAQLNKTKLTNGEDLPLLKTFLLETIKQRQTRLDLEIKPSIISKMRGLELGDSVLSLVHQLKAQPWIHYVSFDYDILKRIRIRDPGSDCAYLVFGTGDAAISTLLADGIGMDYCYNDMVINKTTARLNECINAGIYVSVWTVDVQTQMSEVLSVCPKISAIVTNRPELALTLIPRL